MNSVITVEFASFGIAVISLAIAIAALVIKPELPKGVRNFVVVPSIFLMCLFTYIGLWATDVEKPMEEVIQIYFPILIALPHAHTTPPSPPSVPNTPQLTSMPKSTPISTPTLPAPTATPVIDWSIGQNSEDSSSSSEESGQLENGKGNNTHFNRSFGDKEAPTPIAKVRQNMPSVGNLVLCIPPGKVWVRLYRIADRTAELADLRSRYAKNELVWERIPGSFTQSPIFGLPVDSTRFGTKGEPYYIEIVVDNQVVHSTGDFFADQPEFRLYPYQDNYYNALCG